MGEKEPGVMAWLVLLGLHEPVTKATTLHHDSAILLYSTMLRVGRDWEQG